MKVCSSIGTQPPEQDAGKGEFVVVGQTSGWMREKPTTRASFLSRPPCLGRYRDSAVQRGASTKAERHKVFPTVDALSLNRDQTETCSFNLGRSGAHPHWRYSPPKDCIHRTERRCWNAYLMPRWLRVRLLQWGSISLLQRNKHLVAWDSTRAQFKFVQSLDNSSDEVILLFFLLNARMHDKMVLHW